MRLVGGSVKVLGAAAFDDFLAQTNGSYDAGTDAGVDTLFSTVALPAFYAALPPTVELLDDDFEVVDEVRIDVTTANENTCRLHGTDENHPNSRVSRRGRSLVCHMIRC